MRLATLSLVPALLVAAPGIAKDDIAAQFDAVYSACYTPDGSGRPGLAPPINDCCQQIGAKRFQPGELDAATVASLRETPPFHADLQAMREGGE